MRAIVVRHHGPPESLLIEDLPSLVPSPGELIVAVHAAAVNYPDTLIIEDKYQLKPPLPFSPGSEVAGTIKALGQGVVGFELGEAVIAACRYGGYAEEVRTTPDRLVRLPRDVSMEAAAALLVTYGTTHYALVECAKLRAGETMLVLGASGGIGLSAIELGKRMGARVIAAASSEDKLALCRECGADDVILYSPETLKEEIRRVTAGAGIDVVYDPVGGDYAEPALRGMAWQGRYLVVGFTGGIPRVPLNLPLLKGCSIMGVFYGAFARQQPQRYAELRDELVSWFAQGLVNPRITARYPLEEAAEALKRIAGRKVMGKIVLTTALGRELPPRATRSRP